MATKAKFSEMKEGQWFFFRSQLCFFQGAYTITRSKSTKVKYVYRVGGVHHHSAYKDYEVELTHK